MTRRNAIALTSGALIATASAMPRPLPGFRAHWRKQLPAIKDIWQDEEGEWHYDYDEVLVYDMVILHSWMGEMPVDLGRSGQMFTKTMQSASYDPGDVAAVARVRSQLSDMVVYSIRRKAWLANGGVFPACGVCAGRGFVMSGASNDGCPVRVSLCRNGACRGMIAAVRNETRYAAEWSGDALCDIAAFKLSPEMLCRA
ncbi:MAG: hypothetical protein WC718_00345 [Phycisphaerales bacterium]